MLGHACAAGLSAERAGELAVAVHVRWPSTACATTDRGRIEDPTIGRTSPPDTLVVGRGLCLANQLCDLVQIRSDPHGTSVRVLDWL